MIAAMFVFPHNSGHVADLTAAARVFQVVRPPEAPYLLQPPSPPAVERLRAEASGRRAFEWVKEMYPSPSRALRRDPWLTAGRRVEPPLGSQPVVARRPLRL